MSNHKTSTHNSISKLTFRFIDTWLARRLTFEQILNLDNIVALVGGVLDDNTANLEHLNRVIRVLLHGQTLSGLMNDKQKKIARSLRKRFLMNPRPIAKRCLKYVHHLSTPV